MRTSATPLLPIFRSAGQGRLLARIYLGGDRLAPIAQLARELGIDAGGLTREADRLEDAGLIRSERVGRQRLLKPNTESLYYPEMQGLLLKAFGPATLIGPALADIQGIEQALLFGSWAARYLGEQGTEPGDVDLLLIGSPPRRAVARAASLLSEQLGREVNATIVSPERWRDESDGFIRQVKRSATIDLVLLPAEAVSDG